MATRTFRILGSVIDAQTQNPVPNVQVEAMDVTGNQSGLGSGTTDGQGRFQITADVEVPENGIIPATLQVFQNGQSMNAKGDTSIPNLFGFDRSAVLQVQVVQVDQPLKDHITVSQVFTAMNFIQQSDFAGVFREGRDRTTAVGSVAMDSIKTALKSIKMPKPLQPSTVRNRDVINQDPVTAQRHLEEQKITVTGVQAYQPGVGNLGDVTSIGSTIKPGDQVVLYQENNVVKAYKITRSGSTTATVLGLGGQSSTAVFKDTVSLTSNVNTLQANVRDLQTRSQEIDQVKAAQVSTAAEIDQVKAAQESNAATLAALQQKATAFDQLQLQLTQVQAASAQKDKTIAQLQNDVSNLQKTQATISKITPDRIAALEASVQKLQGNK